jgi:hypothetical protein
MSRSFLPAIGSDAWNKELVKRARVQRAWVDALLEIALWGPNADGSDAHELSAQLQCDPSWLRGYSERSGWRRPPAGDMTDEELARTLEAAAWILLHERHPDYAHLMYLGMLLTRVGAASRLGRWIVRQLATMLVHGPPAVRESAGYYLCVDVFSYPEKERDVFPQLVALLPPELHLDLLEMSSGVAWEHKRAFYGRLAARPTCHAALSRALLASCNSHILGSSDAVAFRDLMSRMDVGDQALARDLALATGTPVRAIVIGLLLPGSSAPKTRIHPGRYLMRLDFKNEVRTWLIGSELWRRKRNLGRFIKFRYLLEPEERARMLHYDHLVSELRGYERLMFETGAPTTDADLVRWHCIDGPTEVARDMLGQEVELWPPGLYGAR